MSGLPRQTREAEFRIGSQIVGVRWPPPRPPKGRELLPANGERDPRVGDHPLNMAVRGRRLACAAFSESRVKYARRRCSARRARSSFDNLPSGSASSSNLARNAWRAGSVCLLGSSTRACRRWAPSRPRSERSAGVMSSSIPKVHLLHPSGIELALLAHHSRPSK